MAYVPCFFCHWARTGHPLKSPFHLYFLGQVCLAPLLPPGSCKLFLPRILAPCHVSWVHSTGYPFMAIRGHGMYICVHTCVCVACSSACLAMLLPAPLPSMSQMFLWLQSPGNTGAAFRQLVATTSQDLLCRTECEPIT